jgi:two-component system sensor histidine kinase PilS (NtrC family)
MDWFSLKPLIDETVLLLKGDSRFTAVNITNSTPSSLRIFADYSLFKQVVWNLVLNAAESMRSGGTITVATVVSEETANLSGGDCNKLEISITDTGDGISEKNMHLLFEPFFTTKAGGTGLGLATVYRIIESHHGYLSVESNVGHGSCFRITLPLPQTATNDQ